MNHAALAEACAPALAAELELGYAQAELGVPVDHAIDLVGSPAGTGGHRHRQVAIRWEGGVVWLDMSEQNDHFCIDMRQLRGSERLPMGAFGIQGGRRVVLDDGDVPKEARLTAHNWPATTMLALLTEKTTRDAMATDEAPAVPAARDREAAWDAAARALTTRDVITQEAEPRAFLVEVLDAFDVARSAAEESGAPGDARDSR